MIKSSISICSIIFAVFFLLSCDNGTTEPEPGPPLTNRVYIPTNITVTASERFTVPVYFDNSVPISAISVPLTYSSDDVQFDSASFIGSRIEERLLKPVGIYSDLRSVVIGVFDTTAIIADTGRGLLVTLYFWAYGYAPETDMTIDTTSFYTFALGYADTLWTTFGIIPEFTAGKVHIKPQL